MSTPKAQRSHHAVTPEGTAGTVLAAPYTPTAPTPPGQTPCKEPPMQRAPHAQVGAELPAAGGELKPSLLAPRTEGGAAAPAHTVR